MKTNWTKPGNGATLDMLHQLMKREAHAVHHLQRETVQ